MLKTISSCSEESDLSPEITIHFTGIRGASAPSCIPYLRCASEYILPTPYIFIKLNWVAYQCQQI